MLNQGQNFYKKLFLLLGIIMIAGNLRAPITAIGPVIASIQEALQLSTLLAGFITTIPLLAFALLSPVAPTIARKIGIERTLGLALLMIAVGLLIRPFNNIYLLYTGTALIGGGIALGNVLIPALIKQKFPNKTGLVTGIFSVSMNLFSALAAACSIAIGVQTGWSWKGSISIWIILTILALIIWLPQVIKKRVPPMKSISQAPLESTITVEAASINTENHHFVTRSLRRSPLAWQITAFMGLQSILFYCAVAWLPTVLQRWGMNAIESGFVLSYIQLTQIPVAFIGPIIAVRLKNQSPLVVVTGISLLASISLILFTKTSYIIPAVILYGIGTGLSFSLSLMFFVLRTKNSHIAAELSGMAQSFGYLLAAVGPPIFGLLEDLSNNWYASFVFLLLCSVALIYVGMKAARPGTVES